MSDDVIVDLSNYKDRVGNRVMPGRYRVVVEDAEMDSTKDKKPMINLWLRVQGGEFDGATIIDRLLPQHEKALFRVVGFMQAIGLPTPKKRLKVSTRQFVGKVLDIDVEDGDPYNGRVKSEVRGYARVVGSSGGGGSDVEPDDLPGDDDMSALDGSAQDEAEAKAEQAEAPVQTKAEDTSVTETADEDADVVDLDSIDLG